MTGTMYAQQMHITLDKDTMESKDVFVVGDVHGCLDELKELLTKANIVEENNDTLKDDVVLIFVGDIVNKGPKTAEVVKYIKDLGPGVYSVRGNHEEKVIKRKWKRKSYCVDLVRGITESSKIDQLTISDVEYLESFPYTISIPHLNSIIVHAGILPSIPLHEQTVVNMTCMRNIVQNSAGAMSGYVETDKGCQWADLWPGPQHVYYGHDARRGKDDVGRPRVQLHQFATGLDTRCVKGGELTGIFLNSKCIHSVKAHHKYSD
ncbi:unnamed protein product [Owenia fusiformis]|uniref:Calcineurin-like phosphoesterase domain-containing protein n=1 Tax=Owenia fusiformis TaxID=6347 RepID=A0A8S4N2J3_OWEFU|nr:unnamed protein product [Owenia fusiformis]